MSFTLLDWIVLLVILLGVTAYGIYKGKSSKNLDGYFRGDRQMRWGLVLLSVMGTQASAVTFLTVPGQSFTDGMQFIQFYFGLPLAMVVLCITFVPIFRKMNVYTAYEYLEQRFDRKTRTFTAFVFLISRGLSTGISIVAPSLILHAFLGWNLYLTNFIMGGLLIVYTVTGGAKAVAYTQQLQFIIIYVAMFLAAWWAYKGLPQGVGAIDAFRVASAAGKTHVITSGVTEHGFDWSNRYNIWSGLIGGLFLQLSYFGTDQSQVGRYLTARSVKETRVGLLLNGLVKIPIQFGILLIGIFIFAFYQYEGRPAFFDVSQEKRVEKTAYAGEYNGLKAQYVKVQEERRKFLSDEGGKEALRHNDSVQEQLRDRMAAVIQKASPGAEVNRKDANFVFLRFVGDHMPSGLVGLIIAIIFLAAWSSIAAALNSLASCTIVDFHKQYVKRQLSTEGEYSWSKIYTLAWGLFCILMTFFANNIGNSLVEAVNILGSWFYGTMLGIFLVAFYVKWVRGTAVFWAAILAEIVVIVVSVKSNLSYLWFTVLGTLMVLIFSILIELFLPKKQPVRHTLEG